MILIRIAILVCALGVGFNVYSYPGDEDGDTLTQEKPARVTRRTLKLERRTCGVVTLAEARSAHLIEQLKELRVAINGMSGMRRSAFGTTLYSVPHGYTLPGYDDIAIDAKAIVIGFGGAGVMSASGRTFIPDGYVFKKYGVSMVAFDYPFHADGPRTDRYQNAREFMAMVFAIVRHYEKTGLPIYLMGHSFGPTVIQELLHQSPRNVRGAIYLSPGGSLSPEQGVIYRQLVDSGDLPRYWDSIGIIEEPEGEPWSNRMEDYFTANKGQNLNIRVPIELIAGKHDLYSTAETMALLAQRYPNMKVDLVDGAGHDIFKLRGRMEKYVTEKMIDFIEREGGIMLTEIFKPGNPEACNRRTLHRVYGEGISDLKYYHANSALFRHWLADHKRVPMRVFLSDDRKATGLMAEWRQDLKLMIVKAATQKHLESPFLDSEDPNSIRSKAAKLLATPASQLLDYSADQLLISYLVD